MGTFNAGCEVMHTRQRQHAFFEPEPGIFLCLVVRSGGRDAAVSSRGAHAETAHEKWDGEDDSKWQVNGSFLTAPQVISHRSCSLEHGSPSQTSGALAPSLPAMNWQYSEPACADGRGSWRSLAVLRVQSRPRAPNACSAVLLALLFRTSHSVHGCGGCTASFGSAVAGSAPRSAPRQLQAAPRAAPWRFASCS